MLHTTANNNNNITIKREPLHCVGNELCIKLLPNIFYSLFELTKPKSVNNDLQGVTKQKCSEYLLQCKKNKLEIREIMHGKITRKITLDQKQIIHSLIQTVISHWYK